MDELSERLARLRPLRDKARIDFDQDPYLRDIVERNLEIAAQCCVNSLTLSGQLTQVHQRGLASSPACPQPRGGPPARGGQFLPPVNDVHQGRFADAPASAYSDTTSCHAIRSHCSRISRSRPSNNLRAAAFSKNGLFSKKR